jgi:hypothetical protein
MVSGLTQSSSVSVSPEIRLSSCMKERMNLLCMSMCDLTQFTFDERYLYQFIRHDGSLLMSSIREVVFSGSSECK